LVDIKVAIAQTIIFFSQLHYWNGYENYYDGGYCVRGGITEIREATKCEKYSLMRLEIETNTL